MPPTALAIHMSTATANLTTWHRHLGHLNAGNITLMQTKGMVTGMDITKGSILVTPCELCLKGKQTHAEICKMTDTQADIILGHIFLDICGHMSLLYNHFIYFVTWIDNKSQKVFVNGIKLKSCRMLQDVCGKVSWTNFPSRDLFTLVSLSLSQSGKSHLCT